MEKDILDKESDLSFKDPMSMSARLRRSLMVSFIVTMFLFFIDEGYYEFRWMKGLRNWVAFVVYIAGFTTGLMIMNRLTRKMEGSIRTLTLYGVGLPLGFIFAMAYLIFVDKFV